MEEKRNKPEIVLRDGSLKASIWQNDGEKGPFWTTTYAKTITGQDGNPRDVQSFSQTENLRISVLGHQAYGVINDLRREFQRQQSPDHGQQHDTQSHDADREAFKQKRSAPSQASPTHDR